MVKAGRVNVETLYLIEKGALLFMSVNLIAASLGLDTLAWSKNSETEFVFGWNSWIQTDISNSGVLVIRDRNYDSSECTLDSCSANEYAGRLFLVLNLLALCLLGFCCAITLEMAVFHFTVSAKKIANVLMAVLAFTFNLISWSYWSAESDTSEISKENAGNSTFYGRSFWYSVFGCFFLFVYCILVIKQNVINYLDKQKDREDARPLSVSRIPSARGGKEHKNEQISALLQSRVVMSESDPPPPPSTPDLPRKLTADPDSNSAQIRRPDPTLALKNVPPPLPPRPNKDRMPMPPVMRIAPNPAEYRRRSRGLPPIRKSSADEEIPVDNEITVDNV